MNPGIRNPPNPPEGGSRRADEVFIEETYRTPRGRLRRRQVAIDVQGACRGLGRPGSADDRDWKRIRQLLATKVGETTFEIWLAAIELGAVDVDGTLILLTPDATRAWVCARFQRLIYAAADGVGRRAEIADAARSTAILAALRTSDPTRAASGHSSENTSYDTSAYGLSYTPAYNPAKEVCSW